MSSPGRRFVSALAIMVLVLAGGLFGLTHSRSVPVRIGGAMDEKSTDVHTTLRDPWQSPRLSSRLIGITPIAVLPLTTYSETVGPTRLIADMMTDDLINTLSRASGLRVISRQTALSYQGRPIDIAAIGAELGVRYVLEGNMRMGDDKLRVNVALIDPASRLPVWSSHIERDGAERMPCRTRSSVASAVSSYSRSTRRKRKRARKSRAWMSSSTRDGSQYSPPGPQDSTG
jgi:TolB-like protein